MQHGRGPNHFPSSRFSTWRIRINVEQRVPESRYRHMLVSTSLSRADRPALLLGFDLAALHQSTLTLLHVVPCPQPSRTLLGLDAIGLLHAAADELRPPLASFAKTPSRLKLRQFVEESVPQQLWNAVSWRGECRQGEVAETVVSFANETAADLLILAAKPFRWWLPTVPSAISTIQRRARANVILVRGEPESLRA